MAERLKYFRSGFLVFVVAFTFLGMDVSAGANESSIDLNGAWQLDHTSNLEEFMKASGMPWWKRKLAKLGSSRMHQTIKHEGIRFEIESESPVETRKDVFIADGVTKLSAENAAGDKMTWTARVENNVFVVDGHGDVGHRIVLREKIEEFMVVTVLAPDENAQCKLFFRQIEPD